MMANDPHFSWCYDNMQYVLSLQQHWINLKCTDAYMEFQSNKAVRVSASFTVMAGFGFHLISVFYSVLCSVSWHFFFATPN